MSETAQISAAQNPAAKPSEADYSDSSWNSDFDALNGIQYVLCSLNWTDPGGGVAWSDQVATDIQYISNWCQGILASSALGDPFLGLNASDAAKLIASLAKSLPDQQDLNYIISACKDIDPSSVS